MRPSSATPPSSAEHWRRILDGELFATSSRVRPAVPAAMVASASAPKQITAGRIDPEEERLLARAEAPRDAGTPAQRERR